MLIFRNFIVTDCNFVHPKFYQPDKFSLLSNPWRKIFLGLGSPELVEGAALRTFTSSPPDPKLKEQAYSSANLTLKQVLTSSRTATLCLPAYNNTQTGSPARESLASTPPPKRKSQKRLLSYLIFGILWSSLLSCSPNQESQQPPETTNTTTSTLSTKPQPHREEASPLSFAPVAAEATPAVVNIATTQTIKAPATTPFFGPSPFEEFFRHFFPERLRTFKRQSLGSGFIIDSHGIIVTNHHVVNQADEIFVRIKQAAFKAKVLGSDPVTDLAVLEIEPDEELPTLRFGDSSQLQVGEWVIAIGNPFGFSHTVTAGIVSATGRVIGQSPYDNFIQTDASINPGNSGGPLLNLKGEVIGINTVIFSQTGGNIGIGFAIPSNLANNITEKLRSGEKIVRGWLGVTIQNLSQDLAQAFDISEAQGTLIADVKEGSPADQAGLKRGDVIIGVNGIAVSSARDLSRKIAVVAPGTEIEIQVIRQGKQQTFTVEIGERPSRLRG